MGLDSNCHSPRLVAWPRHAKPVCNAIWPITAEKDGFMPFSLTLLQNEYKQPKGEFDHGIFL